MDTVPSINDIEKLCTKISRLTFINQDKLQHHLNRVLTYIFRNQLHLIVKKSKNTSALQCSLPTNKY